MQAVVVGADEVASAEVDVTGDVDVAEDSVVVGASDDTAVVLVAEAATYVMYEIVPRAVPEAACVTTEVASYVVVDTTLVVS